MKFVDDISEKEYDAFVLNHHKSHFLQSYGWGQFCNKSKGLIPHYVGLKDSKNKLVATALILERKVPFNYRYGYCSRGFILDYSNKELIKEFTESLKDYMKKNNYIYIKFDPDIKYQDIDENANPIENGENNYDLYNYMLELGYIHKGFNRLYEGNQPRYTFRINLKKDWAEVESKMSKAFLKPVKRSYDYNLIIDNKECPEVFYNLMLNNSNKDGFDPRSEDYYKEFTEQLSKSKSVKYFNVSIRPHDLLKQIEDNLVNLNKELETNKKKEADIKNQIARLEKEKETFENIKEEELVICSLICTYTKNRAWSLYIGSNDLANLTFAVARSYYEAIKDAYENKYEFFDLFGTPGDPNTKYKNLARIHDFKRKFGDEYIEFIGEFDLVNKKFFYKILPFLLKIYRKLRR